MSKQNDNLSNSDKKILKGITKKTGKENEYINYNQINRIQSRLTDKQTPIQNYKKEQQLEHDIAELRKTIQKPHTGLEKTLKINLLTRGLKAIDYSKPPDRLSGENKSRVFVLLFTAIFFDIIQSGTLLFDITVVLAPLGILITYAIYIVSFLVFFFLWKHYDIGFIDRFGGKILAIKIVNFFGESIPIYPGIILNTLATIILIRKIDKKRKLEMQLKQKQEQLKNLRNQNMRVEVLQERF